MTFAKSHPKGKIMLAIIVSVVISCATIKDKPPVMGMPIVPIPVVTVQDTSKVKATNSDTVEKKIEPEVKKLITVSNDEKDTERLRCLNLRWQELALRLLDSAKGRRLAKDSIAKEKDSISASLAHISKQLNTMQKESNDGFREAREARQLNNSTYSMFGTIITASFVIIVIGQIARIVVWLFKRFRKTPAL